MVGDVEYKDIPIELQRMFDSDFEYINYAEVNFLEDHVHCEACGWKIGWEGYSDYRDGYATAFQLFEESNRFGVILRWLCVPCFHKWQNRLRLVENRWLTKKLKDRHLEWNGMNRAKRKFGSEDSVQPDLHLPQTTENK